MPEDVSSSLVRELSVWAVRGGATVPMVMVQGSGQRHLPGGTHQCWGSPRSWGACGECVNHRSSCWASEMSDPGSLHATCAVLWAGQPGVRCTASEGWGVWPAPAQAGAKLCPLLPAEQQSYLQHLSKDVRAGCECSGVRVAGREQGVQLVQ